MTFPTPPRPSGRVADDINALFAWAASAYKELIVTGDAVDVNINARAPLKYVSSELYIDEATAVTGQFLGYDGTDWVPQSLPTGGDVVGPASAVSGQVVLFDTTTGKLIKAATGSGYVIASSGVYSVSATIGVADITGLGSLATLSSVGTSQITNDSVTYAKIQDVSAGDKVLGRISGAGNVEEIDCTSFGRSLIDDANASAGRSTLGLGGLAVLNSLAVDDLSDVTITTPVNGQALVYSSGTWVNSTISGSGGSTSLARTFALMGA